MIIDQPDRLHEGVYSGRADEAPAALLQLLRQAGRDLGASALTRSVAQSMRSGRSPSPGSKFQNQAASEPASSTSSRGAPGIVDGRDDLAAMADDAGIAEQPLDILGRRNRRPCRNRNRRKPRGNSPACARWSARTGRTESLRGRSSRTAGDRRRPGGPTRRHGSCGRADRAVPGAAQLAVLTFAQAGPLLRHVHLPPARSRI